MAVGSPFAPTLLNWYAADALGLLTLATLMLSIRVEASLTRLRDHIEPALFFAAAVMIALYVFGPSQQPLLFTLLPVIMLAAFRLQLFAAMLVVAAVCAVAVIQTAAGHGIIAATNLNLTERMYVLQLFMAANLFTVLPLRALIGERDRLGVAFAESDRLFRRIAEASPAGIIHFDTMARPTFVNGRWTGLTGQEFDALAGDGWLDAIDDRFRGAARSLWARARAADQPMSAEYPYLVDGRPAGWAELNICLELDGMRLLGFVARLTDVSARCAAEAALKEREALYRLVTENAHDVIFRLALDGCILYASSASLRALGRDHDELVGQDFRDRIHPGDAPAFAATRAIRASGGPCADVTIIALTADASPERRRFYDGAGLTGFVTKPIDRALLVEHLGAAAQLKLQRALAAATPADPAVATAALFDEAYLGELRAAVGPDRVDQLLVLLDCECEERVTRILRLDVSGEVAGIRREAHSLKGAASAVGAIALAGIAEQLEQVRSGGASASLIAALIGHADRTRAAIAALLGDRDDHQQAS